ncbi:MAG: hypothetical protein JO321_07540 [Solirubrobacterales bacterium]|nr:hypothetical protein [Solirubrobacterales bacterium]MBV9535247.1 hypothetical protein [Solirubrobacterales bacterium]
MQRSRAMLSWVNRYASLAGRTCCAGRSWVGLDRSLARRQDDATVGAAEAGREDPLFVGDRPKREPDQAEFASTSSPRR